MNLHQNPGIYYQAIGMSLSNTHWRLLSYINVTDYTSKYEQIGSIVKIIEANCELGMKLEMQEAQQLYMQYRYQASQFLSKIKISNDQVVRAIECPVNKIRNRRG